MRQQRSNPELDQRRAADLIELRARGELRVLDRRVAKRLGWRAWRERRGQDTFCVLQAPGEKEPWMNVRFDVRDTHRARYEETTIEEACAIGMWGGGVPAWTASLDLFVRDVLPFAQHVLGYVLEMQFWMVPTAKFIPDPTARIGIDHEHPPPMCFIVTHDVPAAAAVQAFLLIPDPPAKDG